jgi:hypothetical protein
MTTTSNLGMESESSTGSIFTPEDGNLGSYTSNPLTQKLCSFRISSSNPALTRADLQKAMAPELKNAVVKAPDLPWITTIFPDNKLPFLDMESLLTSVPWIVPSAFTEPGMASWMNDIAESVKSHTQKTPARQWNSSYCTTLLSGSSIKRKPDLALLSTHTTKEPSWPEVRGLCEVTSSVTFHSTISSTVQQKAFIMLSTQHDRRFVPVLSFANRSFRITLCDRAGIVLSATGDVERDSYILFRIIIAFLFGDDEVIGYDASMRHGLYGEITSITAGGLEYTVMKKLFSAEVMRGRATQCWHVERGGEQYVIKDSWVQSGRTSNEIDLLKEMADVEGVPDLVWGGEVLLSDGTVDSTALNRIGITYSEERVHRRLVMQPVGERIQTFRSKKELISVLIDLVKS